MSGGPTAGAPSEPIAVAAARGFAWSLLATAVARLVGLLALLVLARLVAPADFGLLALALVSITYADTIGDLGTGMALVHWPSQQEDAAQVTFVMNLALGAAWFALALLLAPGVAGFFGSPAALDVLRTLAWSFPLKYLGNTHDALCQKGLRFRARLLPELAQAAVKAAASVLLAWAGLGVWSLVYGHLLGLAVWTLLLWAVVPWRPRWRWPEGLLGPMLGYGRGIVAVNVLAAVTHHADLVVVGKMLGAAALGFYQMAAKLPEASITVLLWVTSRVLFPALSLVRTQGGAVGRAYLSALRYVSLFTVPIAVLLVGLAEPLVLVAFGESWRPVAPILRALAAYAGLRSLSTPAGDVLKAVGRPGLLAKLGLARAAVLLPALVSAGRVGPAAVAWGMALVTGLAMLLNIAAACRLTGLSFADLRVALRPSLLSGALLGLALLGWQRLAAGLPAAGLLLGGALLGLGTYGLCVAVLSPGVFRHARGLLGRGGSATATGGDVLGATREP